MTESANRERWEGGYVRAQEDGQPVFIIERRVGKHRFHVSTHAHSRRAALEHLDRFERDPFTYAQEMKHGRRDASALYITDGLVEEFAAWLVTRNHPTTQKYANEMEHRLADWEDDLSGRDLRHVDLATLKRLVEKRGTSRQHRIIALKSFCAWLRTEKYLLDRKTDPALDLAVPQAVPEKHRRRKAVPIEHVRAAMAHLVGAHRDCLLVLANTGLHVTELARFARDSDAQLAPGAGDVLGVLQVRHKTGATTRTPITAQAALEAAQRIRARRELPRRMNDALKRACRAAGVNEFTFGVLRHSVATWAVEAGTPADTVAEFLGHKSKSTTLRFYADAAIPTAVVKLPSL